MDLAVKFLKHRLKSDHSTFIGNESEFRQISELICRTSDHGESNSALVIGSAGAGKTMVTYLLCPILVWNKFHFLYLTDDYINFVKIIA